ncbi:unnamed protein product [Trichogramma brassicae]|uniref:Uncharacterized protein n=1 Tax=Trichogramma brassicae TaxID=86971 RepID=A0A6H5I0Q2_9HYME|nr:unnamed protein product [Trichogramma brassicae]
MRNCCICVNNEILAKKNFNKILSDKSQCHKSELQGTASCPRLEIAPSVRALTKTSRIFLSFSSKKKFSQLSDGSTRFSEISSFHREIRHQTLRAKYVEKFSTEKEKEKEKSHRWMDHPPRLRDSLFARNRAIDPGAFTRQKVNKLHRNVYTIYICVASRKSSTRPIDANCKIPNPRLRGARTAWILTRCVCMMGGLVEACAHNKLCIIYPDVRPDEIQFLSIGKLRKTTRRETTTKKSLIGLDMRAHRGHDQLSSTSQ